MPETNMAGNKRISVHDEDFKNSLNSKLQEMSKVADLKARFNQDPGGVAKPPGGGAKPPPAARKPQVTNKPKVSHKPSHTNGSAKPVPLVPNGLQKGLQKELSSVRLKPHHDKPAPSPRADRTSESSDSSIPEWRTRLKPVSPGSPTKPAVTPKPGAKPPPVSHKPSIGTKPRVANKLSDSGIESDGRDHSASGSFGSIKSDISEDGGDRGRGGSFQLATLPPLGTLGPAPRKPPKPTRVKLPPPTGVKSRKPNTPVRTTPVTPSLPLRSPEPPRVPDPSRVPEYPSHSAGAGDDFQETYDDVGAPPPVPSTANRPSLNKNRVSLIPTMDSGDEMEPDELYDDGSSAPVDIDEADYSFPPPPLSLTLGPPPPTPIQTSGLPPLTLATQPGQLSQTSYISESYSGRLPPPPPGLNTGGGPPPPPALTSLPVHVPQTSASSSSSNYPQTSGTSENTGSDSGEIYDPVEEDDDCDQLYEPLDMDGGGDGANAQGPDAAELEKEREAERKRQEKLKKDQERQQKKDEEKRKKEEEKEKKRKEKADKELKKKFKLKGDWTPMEIGYAKADVSDENDKLQVICTKGDALKIIRKESPNPAGKWLVLNTLDDPGYIDAELVQTSGDDFGDEYDAVGVDGGDDFQDIYDDAM